MKFVNGFLLVTFNYDYFSSNIDCYFLKGDIFRSNLTVDETDQLSIINKKFLKKFL